MRKYSAKTQWEKDVEDIETRRAFGRIFRRMKENEEIENLIGF